jgi:hypothetical protein
MSNNITEKKYTGRLTQNGLRQGAKEWNYRHWKESFTSVRAVSYLTCEEDNAYLFIFFLAY